MQFVKHVHWYMGAYRGKMLGWEKRMDIYDFIYKMEPDVWVKNIEHRLPLMQKDVVVSDVRYISELEYLRNNLGFTVVRVYAPMVKAPRIASVMGRESSPGTLYLMETYGKDFTERIGSDYSITFDPKNREPAKKAIEELVSILRKFDK